MFFGGARVKLCTTWVFGVTEEREAMAKRRGLGRPLNAILNTVQEVASLSEETALKEELVVNQISHLPVRQLKRGQFQPRRAMDNEALEELALSIKNQGVLQPILVRKVGAKQYEIVAGERRWRAAQIAGLSVVPVLVREMADEETMAVALIENIQREDLNPVEEALAFQRLLQEFEMTHQQVAEAVGRSRAAVSNLLRLLNLEKPVRILLEHGDLEMGHARALLVVQGDAQVVAARTVVDRNLNVRQTEEYVRCLQRQKPEGFAAPTPQDPDVLRLQALLTDRIGSKVTIKHNGKGRGRVIIDYGNLRELDVLLARIE
jgi:ParB family chromosome partitioning protein